MSSLEFQNGDLWYLWLLLPMIFWLHRLARQAIQKDLLELFGAHLKGRMWQGRAPGSRLNGWLCSLAAMLLLLAVLRPSWGYDIVDYEKSVSEIVVALDVSESMMAADVSPSRYERARRKILDFVKRAQGERLALVSFSGTATVESPLTEDPGAFLAKLSEVDPSLLPVAGSRIDLALYRSLEVLGFGRKSKALKTDAAAAQSSQNTDAEGHVKGATNENLPTSTAQAILLITDGESDRQLVHQALQRVSKAGVRVYVLGVGTAAGAPVPDQANGTGFRKDPSGTLVTSKLDAEILKLIATEGNGIYVPSVSGDGDLLQLYDRGIKAVLSDAKGGPAQDRVAREMFQIPLMLALLLLAAATWRSWGRVFVGSRIFSVAVLLGLFSAMGTNRAEADDFLNQRDSRARRAYEAQDYAAAAAAWKERLAERGAAAEAADYYNLGNALYRLGDMAGAAEAFKQAGDKATQRQESPQRAADIFHNLGNSFLRQGRPKEAIESYEKSLNLRPHDKETEQNLSYAREYLARQQREQKRDNEQNKQSQQKDREQQEQRDHAGNSPQKDGNKDEAHSAPEAGQQDGQEESAHQKSGKQQAGDQQQSPSDQGDKRDLASAAGEKSAQPEGSAKEQPSSNGQKSASGLSRDEVEKALNKIADDATAFRKRRAATDAQEQLERYGGNPKGGPEW